MPGAAVTSAAQKKEKGRMRKEGRRGAVGPIPAAPPPAL